MDNVSLLSYIQTEEFVRAVWYALDRFPLISVYGHQPPVHTCELCSQVTHLPTYIDLISIMHIYIDIWSLWNWQLLLEPERPSRLLPLQYGTVRSALYNRLNWVQAISLSRHFARTRRAPASSLGQFKQRLHHRLQTNYLTFGLVCHPTQSQQCSPPFT